MGCTWISGRFRGDEGRDVTNNLGSIRRDIDTGLPPLLTTADGAPDSIAKVMPAYRNVEALYDVPLKQVSGGDRLGCSERRRGAGALAQALGKSSRMAGGRWGSGCRMLR